MSDTDSPGMSGSGDRNGASWPEYLGSEQPEQAGGGGPERPGPPRRVIGTPSPAAAHTMLAEPDGGQPEREPFLPPEPADRVRARKAELIVSACFILAMLAGFGFLVAYAIVGVGSLTSALHSNLWLGGTLSVVFLLLAAGSVIWVRHLMPTVEITEQRHLMRSSDDAREEFKETFDDGAAASQFVSRPLVRRTLIAATVPLAVAPVFLLRDLGPLPQRTLDTTVWRKGLRLLAYGTGRPITAAEFNSPGGLISVGPEGYLANDDEMAKAAVIIIKFRPGQLVFGPPARPGAPSAPNLV
ncbi:MAG: hypothetical protein J2P28_10980, partial [Actinobacteria bacterium]|nr:hypothetical protein [Actinomycetota bacterium]